MEKESDNFWHKVTSLKEKRLAFMFHTQSSKGGACVLGIDEDLRRMCCFEYGTACGNINIATSVVETSRSLTFGFCGCEANRTSACERPRPAIFSALSTRCSGKES